MAGTWSVLDNLGNLAEESTDPAEGTGLFALTVGMEGQIPFCPTVWTVTVKRDETVGFGQIKFKFALSVFVYKITLAVIAFDYVPVFTFLYLRPILSYYLWS